MKKTAEEVSEHLYSMEGKLGSLKHRQLLGFQTDVYSSEKQKYCIFLYGLLPFLTFFLHRQVLGAKKKCRILAAQIRLLMELPEIIWKQVEAGSISSAAQIQQLGYHLHTGLSVESGIGGSAANIQNWFPVINQQKVSLASFGDIIVKESTAHLMEIQLTLEVIVFSKTYHYSRSIIVSNLYIFRERRIAVVLCYSFAEPIPPKCFPTF